MHSGGASLTPSWRGYCGVKVGAARRTVDRLAQDGEVSVRAGRRQFNEETPTASLTSRMLL